jgi:hypothetical protein
VACDIRELSPVKPEIQNLGNGIVMASRIRLHESQQHEPGRRVPSISLLVGDIVSDLCFRVILEAAAYTILPTHSAHRHDAGSRGAGADRVAAMTQGAGCQQSNGQRVE